MRLLLAFILCLSISSSPLVSGSACTCSFPKTSSGTVVVDNARQTLLSGTLPAGVVLEDDKDVYCKWKGYKLCCGAATEKCHIKANNVSENFPNKNVHFKGHDDSAGFKIESCVAASLHSVLKTVSCFYYDSPTAISGLSDVEMAVKEPLSCHFTTITLSESEMDIASTNLNEHYIDKTAEFVTFSH